MIRIKEIKPSRKYTGEMWRTNASNKTRLMDDFNHRCAYCDDYDGYSGGPNSYHVEHFAPKEKFSELEFTYDNLLYSCPYCNISKSNKWSGKTAQENIVDNKGFVDPCTDEYYTHLERDELGNIIYTSDIGKYMYTELKLYLKRHKIIYNLELIRNKRKVLLEKIKQKESLGQDATLYKEVYSELCVVFCEYYDLFFAEY